MTKNAFILKMLEKDTFSNWLGIQVEEARTGYCKLSYHIKPEMLNGFSSVHGGILFSASDSALAFAANTHGNLSVALEVSISFTRPAFEGDKLIVIAEEIHLGKTTAIYDIKTYNKEGKIICIFKGTVYRTGQSIID
ncbi:MAG TPA: hotdog fold thioesterase [Edaphocola sp.]|nr:hotdog fold thioesterase [Edaphocola sp.]